MAPLTPSWVPLRPCDHAARIPAVSLVRDPEAASDPVHRQAVCNSSCAAEMGTHSAPALVFVVIPQVQFLGKVIDAPVVVLPLVPMVQTVHILVVCPQL